MQHTAHEWQDILAAEFSQEYGKKLEAFLDTEYASQTIYPARDKIFAALAACPYEKVKVVILGQDPYHGAGQALGMAFAVQEGTALPPSLRNIFAEIASDMGAPLMHTSVDLTRWARQGVLLLNTTLTVREGAPGSHRGNGWETLTQKLIHHLNTHKEHLVFILWGTHAQEAGKDIDRSKHLVLESTHPSPLSAYRGFVGSKPFSKTNEYLIQNGIAPIEWL